MTKWQVRDCVKYVNALSKHPTIWSKSARQDDTQIQDIRLDLVQNVSDRHFLSKCDLTGLTMVAWSMAAIYKTKSFQYERSNNQSIPGAH